MRLAVICLLVFLSIGCQSWAVQPALQLPPWVECSLRFAAPPVVGERVTLVAEIHCLLGDGLLGEASIELPAALRVVAGQQKTVLRLVRGRRQRMVLYVDVIDSCPAGFVELRLVAPYPAGAVRKEIRQKTKDQALRDDRLALVDRLAPRQVVTSRLSFHSSRFEAAAGGRHVIWRQYHRGPRNRGCFVARSAPKNQSKQAVAFRIENFERRERMLARRPELRALVERRAGRGRAAKLAVYGEDLYGMASYLYAEDPRSRAIVPLAVKATDKEGVLAETRWAILNLAALAQLQAGELVAATKLWSAIAQDATAGSLRAYAFYNTGEALRLAGKQEGAQECFVAALKLRPGLAIVQKRLR